MCLITKYISKKHPNPQISQAIILSYKTCYRISFLLDSYQKIGQNIMFNFKKVQAKFGLIRAQFILVPQATHLYQTLLAFEIYATCFPACGNSSKQFSQPVSNSQQMRSNL